MYRVTRIDPVGWAKNYTLATVAIAFVLSLLALLPLAFIAVVSLIANEGDSGIGGVVIGLAGGALAFVAVLVAMAIGVFLMSLIQGVAFNWALSRTGGLAVGLGLAGPSETDGGETLT